jgi:hypothetical protein
VYFQAARRKRMAKSGAGRIQHARAAEGAHVLRAEVQRRPGQPAAQVLQLAVAPGLRLAHAVGDRRGEQRGLRGELLEPREDRPRPVDGLAVDEQPGHGPAARAVDALHLVVWLAAAQHHRLVLQALVLQRRLHRLARMGGRQQVQDELHAPTLVGHASTWRAAAQPGGGLPRSSVHIPMQSRSHHMDIRNLTALGAATLSLGLAACGGDDEGTATAADSEQPAQAAAAPSPSPRSTRSRASRPTSRSTRASSRRSPR